MCASKRRADFLPKKARNARGIEKKFVIDVAASSIRHNMYSFHSGWDCNSEAIRVCYCLGSKYQIVIQSNIYFTDLFKLCALWSTDFAKMKFILTAWALGHTHVINTIMVWPYAFKACMHARLARIAVSHGVNLLCWERLSLAESSLPATPAYNIQPPP